jgi:hypothetical protein
MSGRKNGRVAKPVTLSSAVSVMALREERAMVSRVAFATPTALCECVSEQRASSTVGLTLGTEGVATALGSNVNAPLTELRRGTDRTRTELLTNLIDGVT